MHDDRRVRFPLGNQVHVEILSRDPYPVLKVLQEQEPLERRLVVSGFTLPAAE